MENDLISRKSMFDAMRDAEFQTFVPLDEVDEVIANVPSIEAEPKWISVKERLPEKNDMYLAHLVHSYSHEDKYSCVTVCFFNLNARSKWAIEERVYKVTHWMPLPQPPKEG